jgi:hypothetical protein
MEHLDLLLQLTSADWQRKHEDMVSALRLLRAPTGAGAQRRDVPADERPDEASKGRSAFRLACIVLAARTSGPSTSQSVTAVAVFPVIEVDVVFAIAATLRMGHVNGLAAWMAPVRRSDN